MNLQEHIVRYSKFGGAFMLALSLSGFLAFLKSAIFVVGYIQSSNLFPEPLKAEEEKMYLERYKAGDEEARNILIERNLRLVAHVCKKYNHSNVDNDDLISIGTIGLIKGINSFNMEKGVRLATYVSRCIDNEILMYLRKIKKSKTEVSIDASLSFDAEGNELHLEDILGTDADIVTKGLEEKTDKKLMLDEVMRLNPRDRDIIILRYGLMGHNELTQKEVAELLGISQSYISRIEKKVIRRLKNIVKYS